jgi:hypothetical protein
LAVTFHVICRSLLRHHVFNHYARFRKRVNPAGFGLLSLSVPTSPVNLPSAHRPSAVAVTSSYSTIFWFVISAAALRESEKTVR